MKHQSYWSGDCPRYEYECGFRIEVADRKDLPEKCPKCGTKLFIYFTEEEELTKQDWNLMVKKLGKVKR